MAVGLAFISACLFATASALQHRAAASIVDGPRNRPLLVRLMRQRGWLLGSAADVGAVGFQAAALRFGQLSLVQPVLAMGLVLALPLSGRLNQRRLTARDWGAAAAVTAVIVAFVEVAAPHGGTTSPSTSAWLVSIVSITATSAALAVVSRRSTDGRRNAIRLAVASALTLGLAAALTKTTVDRLSLGIGSVFSSWHLYALIVVALAGLQLSQRAFQSGPLSSSLPTLTASEPVVGVALGTGLFHERLTVNGPRAVLVVAAVILVSGGTTLLARSQSQTTAPPGD